MASPQAFSFPEPPVVAGTVVVAEANKDGLAQYLLDGRHHLLADEPLAAGGNDAGPGPYELLLMSLGACTAMTVRLYARRKKWPLKRVVVQLTHGRDYARDCVDCEKRPVMLDHIDRSIALYGPLDASQRSRLLAVANQCPVHRTLSSHVAIATTLAPPLSLP